MADYFPFTQRLKEGEPFLVTPMAIIVLAIKYSQMSNSKEEDLQYTISGWLYQYMSNNNLHIAVNPNKYDEKGEHNYPLYLSDSLVFEKNR